MTLSEFKSVEDFLNSLQEDFELGYKLEPFGISLGALQCKRMAVGVKKATEIIQHLQAELKRKDEALKEGISAHYNLYKSVWGEDSNPDDDLVRKILQQALAEQQSKEG